MLKSGNLDEARAACAQVISSYPDTDWATRAAKLMETIKRETPKTQGGDPN